MDPVSAVAIAGAAFSAIKKGFAFGRDMESMSQDLGRWMGAMSDIKKCEEQETNLHYLKNFSLLVQLKKKH